MLCLTFFITMAFAEVNVDRLMQDVRFLTGTHEPRTSASARGLKEATDYIKKNFTENTKRIEVQPYLTRNEVLHENIIASFGPVQGQRIIIGAHYDAKDSLPEADGASSVAAILELARQLKNVEEKLTYRIDLVAYGSGNSLYSDDMGSARHARLLAKEGVSVKLVLSLDGIGYFTEREESQHFPFPLKFLYPTKGDFISVIGGVSDFGISAKVKNLFNKGAPTLNVQRMPLPKFMTKINPRYSDHGHYLKYGFKALLITDTSRFRNPFYRTDRDTAGTLNYNKMSEVILGLYSLSINI